MAFNEIKTEGFAAIAQILPFVKTLKLLDVRENLIDYPVCKAAVSGLHESTLKELLLDENFRCKPRADLSLEASPSNSSMSPRSAANNNVDVDESWSKPGDVTKLQVPMFSAMPPNLHILNLQDCGITDTQIRTLVQALSEHVSIEKLDLTENNITSEGATAIFSWLQTNASLVDLCLANNNISESCSAVISRTLHNHASIEKLSLRRNYAYGEDHLLEVIHAGIVRGETMMTTKGRKFMLDLRLTNIFYLTRARVQNQISDISSLNLLI
ncbi:hypothetical protein O6H91_Y131700 [Diphasiastrum complanatum]|nr:hypothetical protein O6H91_Y131700 [Diphasiastrum complanatum]